jgi:hypothetical protein
MTTPNLPGGPAYTEVPAQPVTGTDPGGSSQGGAKEQAKQAAGTAADESKHVAGVAKDEAQNIAAEAGQQAKGLLSEAASQVDEQSRVQRDRAVHTLRSFSDDLEQMASQGGRPGMATDLTRQVAAKARDLTNRLDGREPRELLDEVRDFARRKPGTFLLGAMAAGMVAGRLARGTKDAQSSGGSGGAATGYGSGQGTESLYAGPQGTAAGHPTAGVDAGMPAPLPPSGVVEDPLLDPDAGIVPGLGGPGTAGERGLR